jgi:uncharacterized protein (TIGR00730 family)
MMTTARNIPSRPKGSHTIAVFCGSSVGNDPAYVDAARDLGRMIGEAGLNMVFGGGAIGLMGETARAVREAGQAVHGVLPDFLRHLEPPMTNGETLEITADLQERKRRMLEDANGFVILPGGLGTLDEFFEVITSAQLDVFAKPIVVLNTNGFYTPLKALLEHVVAQGFAKPRALELCHFAATPEEAVGALRKGLG